MKSIPACLLATAFAFVLAFQVQAQSAESIWLTASTNSFNKGDTVSVMLNANSATPIQGFTFQVRYDAKCLEPVNAISPVPGMNGLPLPQLRGQVDGSYASTTPQSINGVLAEIRFVALSGCQTELHLESAALAIRSSEGFAAPLGGVVVDQQALPLTIDKQAGEAQPDTSISGSVLPLDPPPAPKPTIPVWAIFAVVGLLMAGIALAGTRFLWKSGQSSDAGPIGSTSAGAPVLQMKHGPQAGRNIEIHKLPCLIGRDPLSDVCINDPHVIDQHAKIISARSGYYLMDLGGETFINGQAIHNRSAALKPGDVVRLGKSALFVFAS